MPTNTRGEKKKDQVFAIKIDFFGVKGRIEEEKNNEVNCYRHQGQSQCQVELFKNGEKIDSNVVVPKRWGNINSYHLYPTNKNFMSEAPLSTTTAYFFKFRKHTCPTSLKVSSQYAKKITIKINKEAIED